MGTNGLAYAAEQKLVKEAFEHLCNCGAQEYKNMLKTNMFQKHILVEAMVEMAWLLREDVSFECGDAYLAIANSL